MAATLIFMQEFNILIYLQTYIINFESVNGMALCTQPQPIKNHINRESTFSHIELNLIELN